jgi:hypothetical protein
VNGSHGRRSAGPDCRAGRVKDPRHSSDVPRLRHHQLRSSEPAAGRSRSLMRPRP